MLPIQLIKQNKQLIIDGLKKKNFKHLGLVDEILYCDEKRRNLQVENDTLKAFVNNASTNIGKLMKTNMVEADLLKREVLLNKSIIDNITTKIEEIEKELHNKLILLPNLPNEAVPFGKTPEENEIVSLWGELPYANDKLPHWELMTKYGLMDNEIGNKITGAGFPVLMGQGAKLQRSLIQYFLDFNTNAGYKEFCPPFMVNEESAYGTCQLPDKEGQMYYATADDLYLVPTAEIPLTNIYRNDIIKENDLPLKLTAYSPCFRREAGSYGKDVRGLNRVHQFDKVEIVQIAHPDNSYELLKGMTIHVEDLLQSLELPYRILRLCGGDMSFASAITYDFEVYSAGQQRWLEVSSVSNFETFQSNRMKIRYKGDKKGDKTQLVHTLNGSALALPRIIACLLENNQTDDGILIPKALQPYFGKAIIN
jgi:seryl-tRNA synthetase